MMRFSSQRVGRLSTSHQRILSVENFLLDFPALPISGDDGCGVLSCVDDQNFLVGDERLDEANWFAVVVLGGDHGFNLRAEILLG